MLLDVYMSKEGTVEALKKAPTILGIQTGKMMLVSDFIQSLGGFSREDLATILLKEPRLMAYNLTGNCWRRAMTALAVCFAMPDLVRLML